MMVQAYLRERAADLESKTCSIEKVIELSASDFKHFRQAPLKDYDFISENKANLHCEQGIWQCLLILGTECEDGILVDPEGFDFALYGQELEVGFCFAELSFFHNYIDKSASVQLRLYACTFLIQRRSRPDCRCRDPPFLKFCPFQNFQNTEDSNMKKRDAYHPDYLKIA